MSVDSPHMMNIYIKGNWQLAKKYIVRLTEDERTDLESLIHKGKWLPTKDFTLNALPWLWII